MAKSKKVKTTKLAIQGIVVTPNFLSSPVGRRALVEACAGFGFQSNHTPWDIALAMVNRMGDLTGKTIRVLFNLEFLQILNEKGVDFKLIQFVADSELEANVAKKLYGVTNTITMKETDWDRYPYLVEEHKKVEERMTERTMKMNGQPDIVINKANAKDFVKIAAIEKELKAFGLGLAADYTITNPPFNGNIDLKILLAQLEQGLIKHLVCVHPSTWLIDLKTQLGANTGSPLYRKIQNALRKHITRLELFNGNPKFNIGLHVPCVITEADLSTTASTTDVKYMGSSEYSQVMDLNNVTLHGADWDPTVKEFRSRVVALCSNNNNLEEHRTHASKCVGSHPVQLAAIMGSREETDHTRMVKSDYYTLTGKNSSLNRGLRNTTGAGAAMSYGFATKAEQDNFLGYLQTDFVRLCLSLLKTNPHMDTGELILVPWLDFTQAWDDDKLFSMLKYAKSHPIRKYSRDKFKDDYHGIYTTLVNGKKVINKTY